MDKFIISISKMVDARSARLFKREQPGKQERSSTLNPIQTYSQRRCLTLKRFPSGEEKLLFYSKDYILKSLINVVKRRSSLNILTGLCHSYTIWMKTKTRFMKLCHLLGNRMGLKSILLSNLMTDMPKTCFHSSTMYGQRMAEHTNQEQVQQLLERSMNMREELIC